MFTNFQYNILLFILVFGSYIIYSDIISRKISNKINLIFFFFSILFLIYNIVNIQTLSLIDFIMIPIFIFLAFFLHYKKIWGAADGKLFISISCLLTAFSNYVLVFNFLLNLMLFYVISITILVLFKTKLKYKLQVLKQIDYEKHFFLIVVIFSIISLIYGIIPNTGNINILLLISFLIFLIIFLFAKYITNKYTIIDREIRYFLSVILFLSLLLFLKVKFVYYFIPIFIFKISLDFISKSTRFIGKKNKLKFNYNRKHSNKITKKLENKKDIIYNSPFTVYLILVAFFTMIYGTNLIIIVVHYFK